MSDTVLPALPRHASCFAGTLEETSRVHNMDERGLLSSLASGRTSVRTGPGGGLRLQEESIGPTTLSVPRHGETVIAAEERCDSEAAIRATGLHARLVLALCRLPWGGQGSESHPLASVVT